MFKIVFLVTTLVALHTYACPSAAPNGFSEMKSTKPKQKMFTDDKKTAVIGLQCLPLDKSDAYKSLAFFENRTILDERTSYFSAPGPKESLTRIYFKVHDKEFVQLSLVMKNNSKEEVQAIEKKILDYLAEK